MYAEWVRQMRAAKTNAGRKAIVAEMCRMYAFSPAKAYKALKEAGWDSGRKRRTDAGSTGMGEEELKSLANMLYKSLRKNGKAAMPVDVARSILQSRGINIPVGDSRLRELLRRYRLSVKDVKTPKPYQRMRSEYPNQIHQVDPSFCLLYFAPGGGQRIIGDDEHYKNKDFYRGGKLKCLRYVLTDHFSSSICVRYYAALGETALNMYDFLLYAWGKKGDPLYAFHGLPETLVWDCGSGNLARPVTNALTAFRITTIPHLPGNPRAKGQVENANNLVETQFESRLRFEPVQSIEELNAAAERWCAAYNASMIPNLDTRLSRNGLIASRLMLWQKIRPEQLRELPDAEICRQIYSAKIETRKVAGDLSITMVHPNKKRSLRYSLAHLPGVMVGLEVNVQPVLVDPEPLVIVSCKHQGEVVSREIAPIAYDESGFDIDAPVYGKNYKREPDTEREKHVKELNALDSSGPAWSFINATSPFIKQRAGEQIAVARPDQVTVHEIVISHFEALRRVSARTGYAPDGFIDRMKREYPEGVPVSRIDDIANEYEAGTDIRLSL